MMARDVKQDFERIEAFVRDYRIDDHLALPEFRTLLSRQHKHYHAILTLLSEVEHQDWQPLAKGDPRAPIANGIFSERVSEFASDLGSALFAWLNGAYKAARLMLRSCVENFVKAFGAIDHDNITTIRNTYEVFDLVESASFFSVPMNLTWFKHLQDAYSILSRDVHTATTSEMQFVAALNFFPKFSHADAASFASLFVRVASAALEALVTLCSDVYHALHYKNRDILNGVISASLLASMNQRERL